MFRKLEVYLQEHGMSEEKHVDILALTLEELRRLHEGALARHRLRSMQLAA